MDVAVRVIKIFGNKGDCFSAPGDVTIMNVFSHLKDGGAEIYVSSNREPSTYFLVSLKKNT